MNSKTVIIEWNNGVSEVRTFTSEEPLDFQRVVTYLLENESFDPDKDNVTEFPVTPINTTPI